MVRTWPGIGQHPGPVNGFHQSQYTCEADDGLKSRRRRHARSVLRHPNRLPRALLPVQAVRWPRAGPLRGWHLAVIYALLVRSLVTQALFACPDRGGNSRLVVIARGEGRAEHQAGEE
jgi:hypothetical protein